MSTPPSPPRRIETLSPPVADLVAAGEVIERPAAALKELIENAVDAGANKIDVAIEEGGIKKIEVADDGCGIRPEDLPRAAARHATSKMRVAADLVAIATLGFRGEALASLRAAAAELTIVSRPRGAPDGASIGWPGGIARALAAPFGAKITARDLFAAVPARRRFLRRPATEAAHCRLALMRVALAEPSVAFSYSVDGRRVFDLPPGDLDSRLSALFGDVGRGAIPIDEEAGGISLRGRVFSPRLGATAKSAGQFFYVNGRFVRDKFLRRALLDALRGMAHEGEPGCVLFFSLPPQAVDVNAHPAKTEVRFLESSTVFQFVRNALSKSFAKPLGAPIDDDPFARAPVESIPAAASAAALPLRALGRRAARRIPACPIRACAPPRLTIGFASAGKAAAKPTTFSIPPPRLLRTSRRRRCRRSAKSRLGARSRSCTAFIFWRPTATGWSSSICTPRTSAFYTKNSKRAIARARRNRF